MNSFARSIFCGDVEGGAFVFSIHGARCISSFLGALLLSLGHDHSKFVGQILFNLGGLAYVSSSLPFRSCTASFRF